jgi:hypothetical protein
LVHAHPAKLDDIKGRYLTGRLLFQTKKRELYFNNQNSGNDGLRGRKTCIPIPAI